MMSSQVEYTVTIHEEDGSFWADVAELPGCFASGDTFEELQDNLAEAIGVYLSTPDEQVSVNLIADKPLERVSHQSFQLAPC